MPTVDDLFYKIGVLTVENDALRGELRKVTKERDDLRQVRTERESDVEKSDEEKKE